MTARPATRPDAIVVVPTSIGATGDAVSALVAEVRGQALRPLGADVIGGAHCADALAGAGRSVEQALDATVRSLEQIARALHAASGAYALADLVAFPQQSR
ncbi:MAG TPA: hypothetical protein VHX15_01380 [Frankiaceae bacterium]|jgi:hypothetical protein|nr:hypothetical protein [Frankiaceae bacterium]